MEYLIPIFLCLIFSVQYDKREGTCILGDYQGSKRKFLFIFLWLLTLSAFEYCVGYDIPIYMESYDANRNLSLSSIWGDSRYRPGWLFLQYVCHRISDNFVILKILQAVFFNFCVYRFLSRYSKYWYLTLFFYILYPYGQLNFGAMRQSFAVGFFLLSVGYLEDRESKKKLLVALLKYFGLVYCATFFHASAFVLLGIPLLRYCVASTKKMTITILIVLIFSILVSQVSGLNMILYSLIQSSDVLEQNSRYYLTGDDYVGGKKDLGLLMSFVPIAFIYICLYLNRNIVDKRYKVLKLLLLAYIIMSTLNLSVPIFYRFNDYFVFAYIILIPIAIYEGNLFVKSLITRSPLLRILIFLMFIIVPVNHLVAVHPAFGFPGYRIYYPYYSVFNPQVDRDRMKLIN